MFRARHFALVLVAGGSALLAPVPAWSGAKPHCRDLTFAGTAGASSNDKVALRMVDSTGTGVDDSCQLQVRNNESAKAFAARLVGAWGPGTGSPCLEPNPLPKKTCGASFGTRSCNHQFKFKPDKTTLDPNDGLIRVRICCFDAANCKGPKMVATPVSAQTKVDPAITFAPTVPPPIGISVTPVALDPIGVTQQPFAALQTCRTALGAAVSKLTSVAAMTLFVCHRDRMQGLVPPATDCNAITPASDPFQRTEAAAENVRTVAGTCAAGGQSPADVGYGVACPCPCQHVAPHMCRAGRIGTPCSSDLECDLVPGAGDGRCALPGWNLVADCATCLGETAIARAIAGTYGVPGPPPGLPPSVMACQDAIGDGLSQLIHVHLLEIANCQRQVDSGSLALAGNASCRDGDPKHRRTAAELKVATLIGSSCPTGTIGPFGCAATPDPAACVLAHARTAAASAAGAIFPELALPLLCSPGGAFVDALD